MKKYVAVILIALLALCGCSSDTPAPRGGVVNFHVPGEFHGTWVTDNLRLPDGTPVPSTPRYIEITANDIDQSAEQLNMMIETLYQTYEEIGVPIEVKFTESNPVYGVYSYRLVISSPIYMATEWAQFKLIDADTIEYTTETYAPDSDTGEYITVEGIADLHRVN